MSESKRPTQKFPRFKRECSGFVVMPPFNRSVRISTADVSREGLMASLEEKIHFGTRMLINIVIGDFSVANLVAHPVWADEKNNYGFEIEQASESWIKFVENLAAK